MRGKCCTDRYTLCLNGFVCCTLNKDHKDAYKDSVSISGKNLMYTIA